MIITPDSVSEKAAAAGVSITAACIHAKMARTTFERWRSGKHSPSLRTLSRLMLAIDEIAAQQIGDHLGRTDQDYAIEFGEYLAQAAEHYQRTNNTPQSTPDEHSDAWIGLTNAIYEFRKRAARCARR